MIRLRIERIPQDPLSSRLQYPDGMIWMEDGQPVGRVIIEQEVTTAIVTPEGYHATCAKWVPVEVIDEIHG